MRKANLRALADDSTGTSAVEYAILLSLVALAASFALASTGSSVAGAYSVVGSQIAEAHDDKVSTIAGERQGGAEPDAGANSPASTPVGIGNGIGSAAVAGSAISPHEPFRGLRPDILHDGKSAFSAPQVEPKD